MRILLLIGVVAMQVLVLAFMAGEREWIVRQGTVVHLQTAPLDPQDPFRGNYVRLDYAINHVPVKQLRGGLMNAPSADKQINLCGKTLYAVLHQSDGCITGLDYVTDQKPDSGLFIRGKTDRYAYSGADAWSVQYGIEAYFIQQNKAEQIEKQRRRDGIQVPLEMEIAVSGKGAAVIKGHNWSALGIGLKLVTEPSSNRNTVVRMATVQLMNVSSNDLAVVDLPDAQSLVLENDSIRSWGDHNQSWVLAGQPRAAVTDADVVVLKPGQQRDIPVDLSQSRWFVSNGKEPPKALRDVSPGSMFRLRYRPPSREECRNLQQAALIWHGELPSSAFGGGRVD
ncbi:MAG: GDYXXLXY domain-containing protein [Kiritimatiellia bacterium]